MALTEAIGTPISGPLLARSRGYGLSAITPASRYYWLRLLLENRAVVASLGFLLLILLMALFAPAITPVEPNFVNPADRLERPSATSWFGTDDLGRDVFSRVVYGSRISLLVGLTVMVGAMVLGSVIGLIAGYYQRFDIRLAREAGFAPANVDATILAETPRIGPHVAVMRERIAACLGITSDSVGVKATTNEGMGAIGRGEGIAALATATLTVERRSPTVSS